MTHINEIEGIGAVYSEKLEAAGIKTVEGLLEAAATPKGRKELESKTGIGHPHLLKMGQSSRFVPHPGRCAPICRTARSGRR